MTHGGPAPTELAANTATSTDSVDLPTEGANGSLTDISRMHEDFEVNLIKDNFLRGSHMHIYIHTYMHTYIHTYTHTNEYV